MKHLLLNSDLERPATVIVLGVGRGGTSLVAGTLRCLGVCMGADPHPVKHEWSPVVYTAEEQVDSGRTLSNVDAMDRAYPLWGWKSPRDLFSLDAILPLLRNPGLIVVTRDLLEVALSSQNHIQSPPEIALLESASVYQVIADRLRFWPYPVLVVSFQEILKNASDFVDLLCSFLQITPDRQQQQQAISFNSPGQNAYRSINSADSITIAESELRADVDVLAAINVERYSKEYFQHFDGMRESTSLEIDRLSERQAQPGNHDLAEETAERMREVFGRFAADLSLCGERKSFSADAANAGRGTGIEALREMLATIDSAAETVRHSLRKPDITAEEGYALLSRLRRIFLLLIRMRTEVQKPLQRIR
jgi:hypothetical protein